MPGTPNKSSCGLQVIDRLTGPGCMSMKSLFLHIGVLLSLTSVVLAQSPQSAPAPTDSKINAETWISIRMVPSVKLETLTKLAQGTIPERRKVNSSQELIRVLREKYGSVNHKIEDLFRLFNSELKSLAAGRDTTVTLPAGPKWNLQRVTLPLKAGEDWREQAAKQIGSDNPKILAEVKVSAEEKPRSSTFLEKMFRAPVSAVMVLGNTGSESSDSTSSEARSISLPYTTEFAVYRLNGTAAEKTLLIEELKKDPGVVSLETIPPTKLFPHWVSTKANAETGVSSTPVICPNGPVTSRWESEPLGIQQIQPKDIEALQNGDRVTIAVLDSGIVKDNELPDKPDQRFFYWHNSQPNSNEFNCSNDEFGCDMINGSFPLDDMESSHDPDGFRNHGTHVAGIATGRLLRGPLKAAVDSRLRLMVLKVADSNGNINPLALSSAIPYAFKHNASIINLSFAMPSLPAVYYLIENQNKNTLFIAAVGNGRDNFGVDLTDEQQRYLNKLHQAFPKRFITVAAVDESGGLACFSNFSKRLVDIAAPGLEIESTVGDKMTLSLSGTSQAAPYVTLIAAMLKSLGVLQPQEIKDRIIESSDFVPALKGKVASAGRINVAKAISLRDDLIEVTETDNATGVKTRKIFFGKLLSPTLWQIPPFPVPLDDIRKVTFQYETSSPRISRILYTRTDPSTGTKQMVEHIGIVDVQDIEFQVNGESTSRTFTSEQVIDLVRARP
jgi:subtilisin family serine protease